MSRPIDDLADEFVLGLLDDGEAAEVERRLPAEPALARAVARARDRYLALDLTAAPEELPDGFAARIGAEIDRSSASGDAPAPGLKPAANENRPRRLASRWAAAAAALLIFVAGAGIGWQVSQSEPVVIAVLLDDTGTPRAMVEDFGNDTARIRFLSNVEVPQGRVMEVWTLPSADRGPVSLGLVEAARSAVLHGPDLPTPAGDQLYEITLEQAGGSPTGRPTGPIVAKGYAARQI